MTKGRNSPGDGTERTNVVINQAKAVNGFQGFNHNGRNNDC